MQTAIYVTTDKGTVIEVILSHLETKFLGEAVSTCDGDNVYVQSMRVKIEQAISKAIAEDIKTKQEKRK